MRSAISTSELPRLDRHLLETPVLVAGLFRAHPSDPRFGDSGPIERHLFVFPWRFCTIQHEGRLPFLAGPNEITFYNRGQRYRRGPVSPDGDRCAWFAFAPEILADAIAAVDPAVRDRPEEPFPFTHGPSDGRGYLRHAEVVRLLRTDPQADPLPVEETMLSVLERAVADAYAACARGSPGFGVRIPNRLRREMVERAKRALAETFRENRTLSGLAARLGVSVFHLCRAFRRTTGFSLHAYRNALRLRAALENLSSDLTALALDLGYSSHSHFTAAFRKEFGITPSAVRRRGRAVVTASQRERGGDRR